MTARLKGSFDKLERQLFLNHSKTKTMKQAKTTKQPLEDSKNAKPVLRDSSYGDYVAIDMVDERGLIVSTPFYIKEGQIIEAHWPKPSNEQPKHPIHYDDFNDVFQFMMQDGNILSKWANSGLNSVFEIMNKKDLETWEFHKARKIKVIEPTTTPDSKEGLHTQKPNFETLHIGLCSNDEDLQLINELGEHILTIESYPLKENAETIMQAVNERQALPELLKKIYHEIDIECISETENVSMTTIRAILVKHGANEPDLW